MKFNDFKMLISCLKIQIENIKKNRRRNTDNFIS